MTSILHIHLLATPSSLSTSSITSRYPDVTNKWKKIYGPASQLQATQWQLARRSDNGRQIRSIRIRMLWASGKVRGYAGWKPLTHNCRKNRHQTSRRQTSRSSQHSIQGKTNIKTVCRSSNPQHASRKSHRTGNNRAGELNFLCDKEGLFGNILRRLPIIWQRSKAWLVCTSRSGRMYLITAWSSHLINSTHPLRVLKSLTH